MGLVLLGASSLLVDLLQVVQLQFTGRATVALSFNRYVHSLALFPRQIVMKNNPLKFVTSVTKDDLFKLALI